MPPQAKEQLMGQLHSLRKRLEGEQKKVQSDIRANSAQYSKLASQARLRTKQSTCGTCIDKIRRRDFVLIVLGVPY